MQKSVMSNYKSKQFTGVNAWESLLIAFETILDPNLCNSSTEKKELETDSKHNEHEHEPYKSKRNRLTSPINKEKVNSYSYYIHFVNEANEFI